MLERAFYVERKSAAEVAQQFGYTLSSFYSLTRDFKQRLKESNPSQQFFIVSPSGRQRKDPTQRTQRLIVELRKKFLSVPDIKARLDALGYQVSERYIAQCSQGSWLRATTPTQPARKRGSGGGGELARADYPNVDLRPGAF